MGNLGLKRLEVNRLKIDKSFIRDMRDDPDDLAILEGILGMAGAFHHGVIAEGVESTEHGTMLLQLGCEVAQGYGIARPMPASEIPGWIATWRPDVEWCNTVTVGRDDLPLVTAGVEHRAWVNALEKHLSNERNTPPPLNLHRCRFGTWLGSVAHERYGADSHLMAVATLHQQVHSLAIELCRLHSLGQDSAVVAGLGELSSLRDDLLKQLQRLISSLVKS